MGMHTYVYSVYLHIFIVLEGRPKRAMSSVLRPKEIVNINVLLSDSGTYCMYEFLSSWQSLHKIENFGFFWFDLFHSIVIQELHFK